MLYIQTAGGGAGGGDGSESLYHEYPVPIAESDTYFGTALSGTGELYNTGEVFEYPRNVLLSSTQDLSTVTISITGTDLAENPQTEDILGPNDECIESAAWFLSVTSISVDSPVTDLNLGIGELYLNVDGALAEEYLFTLQGPIEIKFSNLDKINTLIFRLRHSQNYAITWPSNLRWPRGIAPEFTQEQDSWIHVMNTSDGVILDAARQAITNV